MLVPNWWLGWLPRALWDRRKLPAIFGVGPVAVPFGTFQTPVTVLTLIPADSWFLWTETVALVTTPANPPALVWGSGLQAGGSQGSNLRVTLTEDQTNRVIWDQAPLEQVAGTGPFPNPVQPPTLLAPGTTLTLQIFGMGLLQPAVNCWVHYRGVRVYPAQAAAA